MEKGYLNRTSLYIQSFQMTEYFSPKRALSLRLYVCHSLLFGHYSSDFDETWTTWSYQKFEMTLFSDFENVASMTSWRPFCMFMNAALSRSQFCSDFLQILGRVSKTSSRVCYWKSAKSVNNFRSKKRTAFTTKSFFWFSRRCRRSVVRSPAGTKVLQLDSCYCCDNTWLLFFEKSKWLNIL